MDIMKDLYELKDYVAGEIEKANKRIRQNNGGITTGDLDIIDKLAHSMKSLVTTSAMLEADGSGYSGYYGEGYPSGRGERRNGYTGNMNGMNGRERRDGGYSRVDIREHLSDMMADAPDETTRMEIRRIIDRMDQR